MKYTHENYLKNKEKINERNKIWRLKNLDKVRETQKNWNENNKEKLRKLQTKWNRDRYNRWRKEAIEHYGGKCMCCGEKREVFLAFDHINGGGTKHQKELQQKGMSILWWIIKNKYPDIIQLLCHNCNFAKYKLGKCPCSS